MKIKDLPSIGQYIGDFIAEQIDNKFAVKIWLGNDNNAHVLTSGDLDGESEIVLIAGRYMVMTPEEKAEAMERLKDV